MWKNYNTDVKCSIHENTDVKIKTSILILNLTIIILKDWLLELPINPIGCSCVFFKCWLVMITQCQSGKGKEFSQECSVRFIVTYFL